MINELAERLVESGEILREGRELPEVGEMT